MSTLYELTGTYQNLLNMLYEEETDDRAIKDTLESIDGEIEEKAEGYAKVIKLIESDIEAVKAETARLNNRKKVFENKIEMLKNNLEESMKVTGKTKFKTSLFSFGIQKNPPSVQFVSDETFIKWAENERKDLLRYKDPEIDKKAVVEELRAGKEIFGAQLIQKESLRIK